MENRADKIKSFILKHVSKHQHDIVSITMDKFDVSRTTILRHIQYLINQNKLIKSGTTKQVTYMLSTGLSRNLVIDVCDTFDEFDFFQEHFSKILKKSLNENAYAICEYVITELLNNVKDHSKAKAARIQTEFVDERLQCTIEDDGVGLFQTIKGSSSFVDIRDIIFELSKGKLTRDPVNHSGEGIFFSSRVVDRFIIDSSGYQFIRDNLEFDWTFCEGDVTKGTKVFFEIYHDTERTLDSIFESYTEDFAFNKTDILVELSKHLGERLISRSQAKRVCRRLENFSHITLDFNRVEAVGQGFVDQVFRVFQNEYPSTKITYINATESVDYMIKRCLSSL